MPTTHPQATQISPSKPRAWSVPSKSEPGAIHTVRRYATTSPTEDVWTCTCVGYRFGSGKRLNFACRHIRWVKDDLIERFKASLDAQPTTNLRG